MMGRSTRDKMRWNVERSAVRIELAMGNLKHVEDLAEGRSQLINERLPDFIQALEACRQALLSFREEL